MKTQNQYECKECGELYMDWSDTNTGLCHDCGEYPSNYGEEGTEDGWGR